MSNSMTLTETVAIPVASLRDGDALEFSIYTEIGGRPMIYRKCGQSFGEKQRRQLTAMGVRDVLVPRHRLGAILGYMQDGLAALVSDPTLDGEQKLGSAYESGVSITEQALLDPGSRESIESVRSFVSVTKTLLEEYTFTMSGVRQTLSDAPQLAGHSVNTCLYGFVLGRAVGYDRLDDLGLALLLHDVGKLAIDPSVLDKANPTEEDWAAIHKHPEFGIKRTKATPHLPAIARDVIQNHHERLDGSGYPRGLRGSELTVATRIAGIVNAFDTRTTHRSYRKARPALEVLREMLITEKGLWDTEILETFVRLMGT